MTQRARAAGSRVTVTRDGVTHGGQERMRRPPAVGASSDPRGRRVVVFTSVGGWGVLAADACADAGLELIELPESIRSAIDERVPARWSGGNPIDLAGGETRDTIPEVLDLVCAHPDVDAVLHLGIGIQAATAAFFLDVAIVFSAFSRSFATRACSLASVDMSPFRRAISESSPSMADISRSI